MNYQKHYDALIQRAQHRIKPTCYTEKHHVVPRCIGGTDDASNFAVLTAREHFVAHQRLVKKRISDGIKNHLKTVPGGFYAANIKAALASQTKAQLSANAKKARYQSTWQYREEKARLDKKARERVLAQQRGRDVNAFRTTEQRIADATKTWRERTPEQRAAVGRKISEAKKRNNQLRKACNAE